MSVELAIRPELKPEATLQQAATPEAKTQEPNASKAAVLRVEDLLHTTPFKAPLSATALMSDYFQNSARLELHPTDAKAQNRISDINRVLNGMTDNKIPSADPYSTIHTTRAIEAAKNVHQAFSSENLPISPNEATAIALRHVVESELEERRKAESSLKPVKGGTIAEFTSHYPSAPKK